MAYPRHTTLSPEEKLAVGVAPQGGPVKECEVTVSYLDGTEGTCRYERLGPAYHRFEFRYKDGAHMSRRYFTRPLEVTIEAQAQEMAVDAFMDAVEMERRDYFARITEPTSGARKPDAQKFQLDAKRVKIIGGMYGLCIPIGKKLVMVGGPYKTLIEANDAWSTKQAFNLVVACCNRMDRCWELPKYNPLYATNDPRVKEVVS